MNNLIAITAGDLNGIGIDILIDIWKKKKIRNFVLFCNYKIIKDYLRRKKIIIKLNKYNKDKEFCNFKLNCFNIYSYSASSIIENTYKSILISHKKTKDKEFLGIITLPLRKDLIKKIDPKFIGHTELFQNLDKKKYSNMILYNKDIIISTLTTHIKLKSVTNVIKKNNYIYNQIINLNDTLIKDFNIKKPKIIISGLNPHAGENGKIGKEELSIIKPSLNKIRRKGIKIYGPYSADSLLINSNLKIYDCFIFIYHDQALIPFKYISQFSGINYTGNLNIIRVSPDHGTAYNLKKSKKYSDQSIINCFKIIKKVNFNRIKYEKSKKITKSKLYN